MVTISRNLYTELESLTFRIDNNSASLDDYKRYELLLVNAGLPKHYIYDYLRRAGFSNWDDFVRARKIKEQSHQENLETAVVGGIIGLGIGLLLAGFLEKRSS
jgi:hypothetical protein